MDETLHMRGVNLNVHFTHAQRHFFAWRGPFDAKGNGYFQEGFACLLERGQL